MFIKRVLKAVAFSLILGFGVSAQTALAQDAAPNDLYYASVHTARPDGWNVRDSKLFSGATPSKAWILNQAEDESSEVLVGAIVTEGVADGLRDQATTVLIKSYLEAFAISWGARVEGASEGEIAVYCGGKPGHHIVATFGNEVFDYYGCMVIRSDKGRAGVVVTWIKRGKDADPEAKALPVATRRLTPFVQNVTFDASK